MESVADFKEIVDAIKENGGEAFKLCFQCGLCDVVCPWNQVRDFSMRKIVREAAFGLTEIESEDSTYEQGGVYTTYFKSAGIYDPNSVGCAEIEASAEFFENEFASVELVGAQYWPDSFDVTVSPGKIFPPKGSNIVHPPAPSENWG